MPKNDSPTIQEKIDKLDRLVAWFESDEFVLEQASTKLKEAAKIATEVEHDLATVENEIKQVKRSFQAETDA